MNNTQRNGASQYQQIGAHTGAAYAEPQQLIQMLLAGALDNIAGARGCMLRGDVAGKGSHVGKAISIVEGLRASLNHQQGGEIAGNLEALYEYIGRRLVESNLHNKPELLDEVSGLLGEVRSAWDAICTAGARR